MKRIVLLFLAFVAGNCCRFKESGIVPDVIDKAPGLPLQVTYGNNYRVIFGNELTPTQVKNEPHVHYPANTDDYYTIILVDPDAPSRENNSWAEWNHWMVCNIPGARVTEGDVMAEYVGSAPPVNGGLHRYVFLAYKQPGQLDLGEEVRITTSEAKPRVNFSVRDFTNKYGLGDPVAGNFFVSRYDDYVPTVYEQFTD